MIVLDACVAAKWLLPEAGSRAAIELQESADQLLAPDLIRMEVAAAITRRVRADVSPLPGEEALERCAQWFKLLDRVVISLIPERELLPKAVCLSVEFRHPLQDCLYLAASIAADARLVTADRTFFERLSPAFPRVSMLEASTAT